MSLVAEPGAAVLDVVVVSHRRRRLLLECCASVERDEVPTQLIVVDNASDDGSPAAVRERHPEAVVVELGRNAGFAAAVNLGLAAGAAPAVMLLNNDARLRPGAAPRLLGALEQVGVVAAGPRLVGPEGQVELSTGRTMSPWNELFFKVLESLYRDGRGPLAGAVERYYGRPRETASLTAACLVVDRVALEEVGGLDERFFLYAEDVDLCRRLRQQGGHLRYVPEAVVEHDRGASGTDDPLAVALAYRRSQVALYRKHLGSWAVPPLRAWLALRYGTAALLARGATRRQACSVLRWVLREAGSEV